MATNTRKVVDNFFYFMWNQWSEDKCMELFKENKMLGEHIWNKWLRNAEDVGPCAAVAPFYASIDNGVRQTLIDAAMEHYGA